MATKPVHRPKVYQCGDCDKRYSRPSLLDQHRRTHTGERPFACDICGHTYMRQTHLDRHRLNHAPSKPISCTECGKGVNTKQHLDQHMRMHRRDHRCDYAGCSEAFRLPVQLERHQKKHLFVCACGTGFPSETKLTIHNNKYHGDNYHCGSCDFTAASWIQLQDHVKEHRVKATQGPNGAPQETECDETSGPEIAISTPEDHPSAFPVAALKEPQGAPQPLKRNSAGLEDTPPPQKKHKGAIALISGAAYDARHIACTEPGCPRRFMRQYDLLRHVKAQH